jgi:CubicO group peptidase (beta-lactamase class C family)
MTEHQVPGLAIAVTHRGWPVLVRGYGYADAARREKVQPTSRFRIASISKPITAVAILQFVERGLLRLDDKVFEVLDYEAAIAAAKDAFDPRLRDITIKHLLQHRGGWDRDQSFDPMFQSVRFAAQLGVDAPADQDAIIRAMLSQPLDFDPGARYAYSNFGYCLLGRVIETLTGEGYEAYVQRHVLAPLGIHSMQLGRTRRAGRAEGEVCYHHPDTAKSVFASDLDQLVPAPYGSWYLEAMDAHGGWIASAADLARFAAALDDPDCCPILSRASIETMHARPPGLAGHEEDGSEKAWYYSLGWGNRDVGDGKINHWHSGSLPGTSAILIRRHDGRNMVALLNAQVGASGAHLVGAVDQMLHAAADEVTDWPAEPVALNQKDDGYRGIWYMNQPSGDQYVYKYSGGLGTYCAKHRPFAVYRPEVQKTFFCYGGTTPSSHRELVHMVSYFDHTTKTVPRPTMLLNKQTSDAHDNPVISVDQEGYIWIFSTSHGRSRPSYIHRSKQPYEIDQFQLIPATRRDGDKRIPITNFSYMQAWHRPGTGFLCFFTRYGYPAQRTICFTSSADGVDWSPWQRLAAVDEGHYQVSALGRDRAGSMFNYHPAGKGLNWRTNVYYVETRDVGTTWHSVEGQLLQLPLTQGHNAALVHDYAAEGLNVYLKDLQYDEQDRPVLLYLTSRGYQSGPRNNPRTWTIARWTGVKWSIHEVTTSDNNYDCGELWIVAPDDWRIVGPTETGPQPYNPGGEIAMWSSRDQGATWTRTRQMTAGSARNHTYVRRPVNAHPDFFALWADGHGRQPSESCLYFSDRDGNVYQLPRVMDAETASPQPLASPQPGLFSDR